MDPTTRFTETAKLFARFFQVTGGDLRQELHDVLHLAGGKVTEFWGHAGMRPRPTQRWRKRLEPRNVPNGLWVRHRARRGVPLGRMCPDSTGEDRGPIRKKEG